jgi:hypothetical protein
MRTPRLALLLLAAASCSSPPKKKSLTLAEMITMDPLPLAKGSKWTYTVNVKRFDVDANKVSTKTIPWTTEVIDAKEGNGVTAFRVRGWPTDLNDYDGTGQIPAPTETTILRKDNSFLFGTTAEPTLDGATGWFDWPVVDGQKICPNKVVYCWRVAAVETGYKLTFYMDSDEQSFELEPGTGVARFHYVHHKSTNEIEAKLVSYDKRVPIRH